jgi:hypothetical protein
MIPQKLRLTLLWWFGTTDPEVIHETQESRRPAPDGEGETTYADMLKRSAELLETHRLPHPACDVCPIPPEEAKK